MAQPTVDQLLNMPWELIKLKGYERDLCFEVWLQDEDIQYLVNKENFVGFINSYNGNIHKASLFDMIGKDTSVETMCVLLNKIYHANQSSLTETTSVEVAIKLIKANLLASLLISSSIEKVFKSFNLVDFHWTFKGDANEVHWRIFDNAKASISETPLQYTISLVIKGVNNHSTSLFDITICNWWTTRINPTDSIKDIVKNNINVEACVETRGKHTTLNSTIEDFPAAIKEAIKQLL